MQTGWQRKRSPEDVPTPVAVAVSDFCRRAGAPASPGEVREALSLLGEDEDFRVRALTDGEPEARPLGPLAVVDVLRGTDQQTAAARQDCGYYDLALELVKERARMESGAHAVAQPHAVTAAPPAAAQAQAWSPTADTARKPREKKAPPPTVAERIAPKKRAGQPAAAAVLDEELPALDPAAHDREKPRPKGRFSNIAPTRHSVDELFTPAAKQLLTDLADQHPDRFALTRALAESYGGKKEGQPLRTEDLERALDHHKLLEKLERKERESILGAFTEQRGATGRVAMALGLSVPELNRLIKALGLVNDVDQIRERFRREALSPKNLAARLDLLGRGKYLSDLGIRRRFDDALKGDLKKALEKHAPKARDRRDLLSLVARAEGTQAELVERALQRLELDKELRRLAPDAAPEEEDHAT